MDGIFVCYHNTREIFGFEYLPSKQMESDIYGNSMFAQQSFEICVKLLTVILDNTVKMFPGRVTHFFFGKSVEDVIVIYIGHDAVHVV